MCWVVANGAQGRLVRAADFAVVAASLVNDIIMQLKGWPPRDFTAANHVQQLQSLRTAQQAASFAVLLLLKTVCQLHSSLVR